MELTEELKREVGQHFVVGFHGHELSSDVKTLIEDYYVGNIILMKRNIKGKPFYVWQTRNLTRKLQLLAKESGHTKPLLVGIDQENGLVSAFSSPTAGTHPGAMAIGATRDAALAEEIGSATAQELKFAGINWVYSPVADVNSDPRNPVIGVRSFGDDPSRVAEFATAVSRGLTKFGVAPAAKHFPGHGDTHVDSHLALPVIRKTKAQFTETELVPFNSLIKEGIATVMTGHMAVPLLTGTNTPSSLSREITISLLKDDLGFRGVVVTDCLEMDAIAEPKEGGCGSEEGAVRALEAGADIAMICHTFKRQHGAVELTYQALKTGRLSLEAVKKSGERIADLKDRFAGTWTDVLSQTTDDARKYWQELKNKNLLLSKKGYDSSTTVLHPENGTKTIPLSTEKKIWLFLPERQTINRAVDDGDEGAIRNTAGPSYAALADSISRRASLGCKTVIYGESSAFDGTGLSADCAVVFVTRNAHQSEWQVRYLGELLGAVGGDVPVVVFASCGPYELGRVRGMGDVSCVASYEFTVEGLLGGAEVIFGGG
ncbi:glycoside hydrolase family 3 protein [Pluteus cervinus]|uniref:Glycoside hydrolase family 3 protein n=1 Tax=Pluteus cervinus TaxID=181527 RepID=A0ACD3AVF2_9AGAR|nr:glycoside hydrolase family 3 protein [Pluteus cervinus]